MQIETGTMTIYLALVWAPRVCKPGLRTSQCMRHRSLLQCSREAKPPRPVLRKKKRMGLVSSALRCKTTKGTLGTRMTGGRVKGDVPKRNGAKGRQNGDGRRKKERRAGQSQSLTPNPQMTNRSWSRPWARRGLLKGRNTASQTVWTVCWRTARRPVMVGRLFRTKSRRSAIRVEKRGGTHTLDD